MIKNNEPDRLRRGKLFHKKIQKEWLLSAEGQVVSERTVLKKNHRKGRVDVFVDVDDADGTAAIVEIKCTDWDRMSSKSVRRNVMRQIRQIWGYLESQMINGEYVPTGVRKDISLGVIFPKIPENKSRLKFIEDTFIDNGIVVVWDDESLEDCRIRNG